MFIFLEEGGLIHIVEDFMQVGTPFILQGIGRGQCPHEVERAQFGTIVREEVRSFTIIIGD